MINLSFVEGEFKGTFDAKYNFENYDFGFHLQRPKKDRVLYYLLTTKYEINGRSSGRWSVFKAKNLREAKQIANQRADKIMKAWAKQYIKEAISKMDKANAFLKELE